MTIQMSALEAADALAWLVAAGADCPVDAMPRNWLAAPVAVAPAPGMQPSPGRALLPNIVAPRASTDPAVALAAAALTLPLLTDAVASFDHPLRQANPPQFISGDGAALLLTDLPDEDPAVQRLTQRMLAAIGLEPGAYRQLNLLPWAPPAGRPPREPELAAFAPFVMRAITLAAPRAILAFGGSAAALAGTSGGIATLRGKWLAVGDVPLVATFHPRLLLKQPELKRLAWADLQAFAARLAA